jgi:hypothetical protein
MNSKEISKSDWEVFMIIKDCFNNTKNYEEVFNEINNRISKEVYANYEAFNVNDFYTIISRYYVKLLRVREPLEYFLNIMFKKGYSSFETVNEITMSQVTEKMIRDIWGMQVYKEYGALYSVDGEPKLLRESRILNENK